MRQLLVFAVLTFWSAVTFGQVTFDTGVVLAPFDTTPMKKVLGGDLVPGGSEELVGITTGDQLKWYEWNGSDWNEKGSVAATGYSCMDMGEFDSTRPGLEVVVGTWDGTNGQLHIYGGVDGGTWDPIDSSSTFAYQPKTCKFRSLGFLPTSLSDIMVTGAPTKGFAVFGGASLLQRVISAATAYSSATDFLVADLDGDANRELMLITDNMMYAQVRFYETSNLTSALVNEAGLVLSPLGADYLNGVRVFPVDDNVGASPDFLVLTGAQLSQGDALFRNSGSGVFLVGFESIASTTLDGALVDLDSDGRNEVIRVRGAEKTGFEWIDPALFTSGYNHHPESAHPGGFKQVTTVKLAGENSSVVGLEATTNKVVMWRNLLPGPPGPVSCVSSLTCNAHQVCDAGFCETAQPLATLSYAVEEMRLADMDANGRLDIVVTSQTVGPPSFPSVQVLRESAGSYVSWWSSPQDTATWAMDIGDCNDDGRPDIVAGTTSGGVASINIYTNTGSTMTLSPSSFSIPSARLGVVFSLALGDVDRDGHLDLALIQDNAPPEIYSGLGGCAFSPTARWTGPHSFANPHLAFGDVNGSPVLLVGGEVDAVMYDGFNPSTWSFEDIKSLPPQIGAEYEELASADFPPSGVNKMITIGSALNQSFVFNVALDVLNGVGTTFDDGRSLAVCDFMADGANELLVADGLSLKLYDALGLVDEWSVPSFDYDAKVRCGDLNGDQQPDAVVAYFDGTNAILQPFRGGPQPLGAIQSTSDPSVTHIMGALADVNGDGFLDIISSARPFLGTASESRIYYSNQGGFSMSSVVPGLSGNANGVVAGDVNMDGRIDLIFDRQTGYLPELILQNADHTWSAPIQLPVGNLGNRRKEILIADFSYDGIPDVFYVHANAANEIFTGNGDGTFSTTAYWSGASALYGTSGAVGDVDKDGKLDVFIGTNSSSVQTPTLLRRASGFVNDVLPIAKDQADVALVDLDLDGWLDLVIANRTGERMAFKNNGVSPYFSLGGTVWTDPSALAGDSNTSVVVADFTGDGLPDMLFGTNDTNVQSMRLFVNEGGFSFVEIPTPVSVPSTEDLLAGDLDRDGDIDVVSLPWNSIATGHPVRIVRNHRRSPPWAVGRGNANTPTNVFVDRPGIQLAEGDLGFGASVELGSALPFVVTLYDAQFDTVDVTLEFENSGVWQPMNLAQPSTRLAASPYGQTHVFEWDAIADSAIGLTRIRATIVRENPTSVAYPQLVGRTVMMSAPFVLRDLCDGVLCGAGSGCHLGACFTECVSCAGSDVCYDEVGLCADPGAGGLCDGVTCPGTDVCYEGACYSSCVSDDDCLPPFECIENVGRCALDACDGVLCPTGSSCFGGECHEECPMSACGNPAESCHVTDGGPLCFETGNVCANVDCPVGEACHEGACYPTCVDNSQCDPDTFCWDFNGCSTPQDVCADVVCPSGESCWMGACFEACVVDTDCTPPNTVCFDEGFCAPSTDLCAKVTCPAGTACHEGACFEACVDDSDCSPPDVCADSGVCLNGTDPCDGLTCPVGDVCYQGACYESCADNGDCNPPFSLCWNGLFCIDTTDPCTDVTCPLGYLCHEGACFEGCSPTDPCASPLECFENYCTSVDDPCDGVICPESHSCYLGGCFGECVSSTDCGTPEVCYGEPLASFGDMPLAPGSTPTLERCAVDPCQDIYCGEGDVCYEGGCFPGCVDDGDCSPPDLCFTDHCATDPCDGIDCEIGSICEGGSCFLACGANMDCPGYVGGVLRFVNVAPTVNAAVPGNKDGGIVWGDVNGDGCLDFVVNSVSSTVKSRLYVSDCALPNPRFTDVTGAQASDLLSNVHERSVIFGDIDNDGDLDFAHNTHDRIEIYENDGSGTFSRSQLSVDNTEGMAWIDFDGDKDLDLMFENSTTAGPVRLWRNNGSGTFTLVSNGTVGLPTNTEVGDYSVAVDIDLDGDVDFLVRKNGTTTPDVYLNDGDGTWTSSSVFNVSASGTNKGALTACDFDNDGDFDLVWTDGGTTQIWEQTGALTFVASGEPSASSGVTVSNIDDAVCGDLDHDGLVDLVLSATGDDYVFMNKGSLTFAKNNQGITGSYDGEGIALGDYDQSGSLDLLINQDIENELWRNPLRDDRYLMIAPQVDFGGGITRAAIGATILIQDPDGVVLGLREVNGGRGHGSQDPSEVHYGLKNGAKVPYALTVTYPHGVKVTKCVVPDSIGGYQRVTILDTESDDLTACTAAGASWATLIEVPSAGGSGGQFCFGDHCAADSCEGIECPTDTTCYGGNCRSDCANDGDCGGSESCYNGVCVDDGDPACDGGAFVCPIDFACFDGACYPSCNADLDCGGGEFCYQGRCLVDDCSSVTCPVGESCHHGICFEDCAVDADCGTGEGCYDGRCSDNGCAALDDTYDADFLYRELDKAVFATQTNVTPFLTPRVVRGADGVSFETWAGLSGSSVTNTAVPREKTARVVLYLDKTRANGDNPDGRYMLWLQHGSTAAGQGAATATYRVHLKNPSGDENVYWNDHNESYHRIDLGSDNYLIQTTVTSGAAETGGVAIGLFDATEDDDWVIRIEASFTGDIARWEMFNPEGVHSPLDPTAMLSIKQVDFDDTKIWAREAGLACSGTGAQGICGVGTGYCEIGELRCQQTIYPWAFEVCDGKDNTCEGQIDEVTTMKFPEVAYRTNSSNPWVTWVTHDQAATATTFMNFVPEGADDRVGSPAMVSTDGTGAIGAWDQSVVTAHRNLTNGVVSLNIAMAAKNTAGAMESIGDYDAETRVRFPGSTNSINELFVAWHDDRKPAGTDDLAPQWEESDRFDLEWEVRRTGSGVGATREGDGAVLQSMWSGAYADLHELQARYYWTEDDNDDDSKPRLKWRVHAPHQPLKSLNRENDLYIQIVGVTPEDSTCSAAAPTATGCQLSRFACVAGKPVCGAADDTVCKRCRDFDGDGFEGYDPVTCEEGRDCDDGDSDIHPGADERCNGLDDDCDGRVDIKDNAAYTTLWSEPLPMGAEICPDGDATCGPRECRFASVCICPDGPEDPDDPPATPCRCGEGLEEPEASFTPAATTPAAVEESTLDDDATCSAAGGLEVSWLMLGLVGLVRRRRRLH